MSSGTHTMPDDCTFERVDTSAWTTGRPELDRRYRTVHERCRDCGATRHRRERVHATLGEWSE